MQRLGRKAGNGWMVFNATRKLAVSLAHQGRFDDALALFGTQDDWVATRAEEWNVHVWHCDHGYVLDLAGRWDEAQAAYEHAESTAERHENWMVVYAARRNLALMQGWRGKLGSAVELSDRAVSLSARLGEALVERNPRDASRRAAVLRDAGRLAEALDLLTAAHDVLSRGSSPYWLGYCADQLAQLYVILGQPERAPALLRAEIDASAPEGQVSRQITRARVARATGTAVKALSGRALELANRADCPARWRWLAQLEAARDADLPEALRLLAEVDEQAGRCGSPGLQLHARALAAGRYVDAGDPDSALQFARRAEPLLKDASPVGMWLPEVHWNLYRSLDRSSDNEASHWPLIVAATWVSQVAQSAVPALFQDSFRNRNRVNRAVLTSAHRAGRQTPGTTS
jgi:tetratricopeptide (TPR) repeat protein